MSTDIVKASPEKWFGDIKAAIENPEELRYATGAVPSGSVIPLELSNAFENFHVRAIAHAASRGEHEALMYLSFYVIHLKRLWTARYRTWESYCDDIESMPYGMSKAGLKTKVTIIGKLLDGGVSIENVVRALSMAPMATGDVVNVPQEKLPAGGLPEAVMGMIETEHPGEAIRYVADLEQRATLKCVAHHWNEKSGKFLFTLRTNDRQNNRTYDTDCVVSGLGTLEAEWFEARLGRRGFRAKE